MRTLSCAGTGRRTVLFLDCEGWSAFDQVACALRRDAVDVIKIARRARGAVPMRGLRWWADRFFYDGRLAFDDPADAWRIHALLESGRVADVIVAEPSLIALGKNSALGRRLTRRSLAFKATPARVLLDKFEVNRRLAAIGILVPRQRPVGECGPEEVAREFGLPIVIKARTGAAGQNVRIVHSVGAIEPAIAELGGGGADLFYQEHIDGERVSYNAVWGEDGPLLEHGFVSCAPQYPMGPSAFVRRHDDADLLKAGHAAAALFGSLGFVSFGFIQDREGRLFHLDPNIRPWGSLLAPLTEGIDFAAAYAALVKGLAWPPPPSELAVLPGVLVQARTMPAFLGALAMLWRVHARRLTRGYALLMSVRALATGLSRLARRSAAVLRRAPASAPRAKSENDMAVAKPIDAPINTGGKSVA